ncbi:MAG: hypothetical protein P8185_14475 [Deltaproteobacteria bacterium]|jgi:hypothetical protein
MTRQDKLARRGWTRRVTYDEPRLSEMAEMYRDIGLEVHLEPFHADEEQRCSDCMALQPELYNTIYTRKKP